MDDIDLPDFMFTPAANIKVYFEIKVQENNLGRIEMELFSHDLPRTCENFRCLCTGEKGKGKKAL